MADRSPVDQVWLDVDQASRRCGISATEIYAALKNRELTGYQRGKGSKWRIHIDDVDAWMRGQRTRSLRSA